MKIFTLTKKKNLFVIHYKYPKDNIFISFENYICFAFISNEINAQRNVLYYVKLIFL